MLGNSFLVTIFILDLELRFSEKTPEKPIQNLHQNLFRFKRRSPLTACAALLKRRAL